MAPRNAMDKTWVLPTRRKPFPRELLGIFSFAEQQFREDCISKCRHHTHKAQLFAHKLSAVAKNVDERRHRKTAI